jgi:hypothetical protein
MIAMWFKRLQNTVDLDSGGFQQRGEDAYGQRKVNV